MLYSLLLKNKTKKTPTLLTAKCALPTQEKQISLGTQPATFRSLPVISSEKFHYTNPLTRPLHPVAEAVLQFLCKKQTLSATRASKIPRR